METGLLNFHDEETFATSIYDQGDLSGVDGRSSLLDMMHSDLQYSSDYLNQSAVHWDSDQEQEHNGDLAVLPVAPSEWSSNNSSREDYQKGLFEWQDNLLSYQPLDPEIVDMRLDSHVIPAELPDNIFDDSYESNASIASNAPKCSLPGILTSPPRCSTPNLSQRETANSSVVSSDGSLNLDMSLSALDVNVSDIDMSALGINVSSLEIKTDGANVLESKASVSLEAECQILKTNVKEEKHQDLNICVQGEVAEQCNPNVSTKNTLMAPPATTGCVKTELTIEDDHELTALFGTPERIESFQSSCELIPSIPSLPVLTNSLSSLPKLENPDVEQLHDIAMEFIKEEQEAQSWNSLPIIETNLDCSLNIDPLNNEGSVLEAGNLESLLEQFEATLKPTVDFSQSMPASPSHFSIPPSPLSMPASPSCIAVSSSIDHEAPKSSSPQSLSPRTKSRAPTPKKTPSSSIGKFVLTQNVLETLPQEVLDRIKSPGRKKTIPLIPAMPSKKPGKSGTRMQVAGATLIKNKLLKLVSRKGVVDETIQLDHDYCSNESSSNKELVSEKVVLEKKTNKKQTELDDERSSRKDSGLESGDVSEDSEGTIIQSGASSGCETGFSSSKSKVVSILKPRKPNQPGRSKEMLMVSVLKKVRCDVAKSSSSPHGKAHSAPTLQTNQTLKNTSAASLKCNLQSMGASSSTEAYRPPVTASAKSISSRVEVSGAKQMNSVKIASRVSNDISNYHEKPTQALVQPAKETVKVEPCPEPAELSATPDVTKVAPAEVNITEKPAEPPKKRKLNLEEYRNRLKAIEQERESKIISTSPKVENPIETEPVTDDVKPSTMERKNEINQTSEVKVEPPELITIADGEETVVKPAEEKRQHRQYRSRQLSSSSSEGSPLSKEVCKTRARRRNLSRKAVWSKTRSRSRSLSSSSSRSRNGSNIRSRSTDSNSSNSSSSSSSGSSRSRSRHRSRSSSSSSCGSSSSSSSRRSNSISSGSSRHSKHSSSSRRSRRGLRSRSRSHRRSRRGRSRSESRSSRSSSWRRRGRKSRSSKSRSSFRRGRCRSRSGWRRSWRNSVSWSRSRSRSQSCRRRSTSRSRSRSGRRLCSFSSQSEYRSRSRSTSTSTSKVGYRSSRSRSCSLDSDLRCSRSRSKSHCRTRSKTKKKRESGSIKRTERKSWRSRSPVWRDVDWPRVEKEHKRQVEERRVVYVGRIPEDTTKAELRRRFEVFGPILDISLHFREHADNYGFVTFAYKVDAYEAVERGNDDPTQPHYELCFGGRRKFCRERYADLDGMACKSSTRNLPPHMSRLNEGNSFDVMLRELQAKLQARKKR